MIGRKNADSRKFGNVRFLPPKPRNSCRYTEKPRRGCLAQKHNRSWRDDGNLSVQIWNAGNPLCFFRRTITRGTTFDDIRNIDTGAVITHGMDHFSQELPRSSHERTSGLVFISAGAFSHKHEGGLWIPFSKNDIFPARCESTELAAFRQFRNFGQRHLFFPRPRRFERRRKRGNRRSGGG